MTDWTPREFEIKLDFLGAGRFNSVAYEDGLNAVKNPRDYQRTERVIDKSQKLKIIMAPGGGFMCQLIKQ